MFHFISGLQQQIGGGKEKKRKIRVEFFCTLFLGSKDSAMATFSSNLHLQERPKDKVPLVKQSFILCLQNNKSVYGAFVPSWCHPVLLHDIRLESAC